MTAGESRELRDLLFGESPHSRPDAPEPELLIALAPYFSRETLSLALLAVAAPPWPRLPARSRLRQQVLAALAEQFGDTRHPGDVWEDALPELAGFLRPALHEQALVTAESIGDDDFNIRVTAGLAAAAEDPDRAATLKRAAQRSANSLPDEHLRTVLLAAIEDLLAEPEPGIADPSTEALSAAREVAGRLPSLGDKERDQLLSDVLYAIGDRFGGISRRPMAAMADPPTGFPDDQGAEGGGLEEHTLEEHTLGGDRDIDAGAGSGGAGGGGGMAGYWDAPDGEEVSEDRADAPLLPPEPPPLPPLTEFDEEHELLPNAPEPLPYSPAAPAPDESTTVEPGMAPLPPRRPRAPSPEPAPARDIRPAGSPPGSRIPALRLGRRSLTSQEGREQVVNTGFASRAQPAKFLWPHATLQPGRDYWFCVEVGRPLARSLEHSRLPTEYLPKRARLFVAIFGFPGELSVDPEHDGGELELRTNGEVVVRSQPLPELGGVYLADRRLFFPVRTPPQSGSFRLRLNIYCEGMLVQSRLVTARVAAVKLPRFNALRAELDYSISRAIEPATFTELPAHKLSLMTNGPGDGSHSFRVLAEDGSDRIKADSDFTGAELTDLITTARATLRQVSWGDSDEWAEGKTFRYGDDGLDLDKLRLDLARLAVSGYRIYTLLVDGLRGETTRGEFERLMAAPGFVLMAAQDSRMLVPLSLVYDYAPFDDTASFDHYSLCDVFANALANPGSVEKLSCLEGNCPHRGEDRIVCPSGFWGYRHFLGLPLSSTLDVQPFLTRERPARLVFGSASDLDRRDDHEASLGRLGATMTSGHSRAELLRRLRDDAPQLVYLYCHGGLDGTQPYLLIGSGEDGPITRAYLYGRIDWEHARPLVVINGCHTTAVRPDQAFDLVSGLVQQANAIGVVGTEVTIGEALACAFGEEFVRRFAIGEETVGEAVRNTRLSLLARGNPLGLVYTPFALAGLRMTASRHTPSP